MKNKKIIIAVVVCLLISGLSFWGGTKYGKDNNPSSFSRQGSDFGGGQRMGSRGGSMNGITSGTVVSKDDKSLTVELHSANTDSAGSKIIFFSPVTKINKTISGAATDISVGSDVSISGDTNIDGSINANSIQIKPAVTPKQN